MLVGGFFAEHLGVTGCSTAWLQSSILFHASHICVCEFWFGGRKKMPTLIIFLLSLLNLLFSCSVKSFSMSVSFVSSKPTKSWLVNSLGPSSAPGPSPSDQGPSVTPRPRHHHHYHHLHHHIGRPRVVAPPPSDSQDCEQTCMEPLIATPFLPPCGCVFPMKVRLILDVALYAVFPVMTELEIEVASGTYMKQSQVRIMGASADSQNQGKTVVDINLVPLGEKFDNTTAFLTYERFWQQKVPLNRSLFGDYAVIYISYPGIPLPQPFGSDTGSNPSENAGRLPFTAIFTNKNLKMNLRTIIMIALCTIILFLVLVGAFFIFLKWRKIRRSSSAIGPAFKSSINKRSGMGYMLSSSITSSTSVSLMSTMATSILSARTFKLSELEKATDKFSLKRVLGGGGFGHVYSGTLEDGTEVAVKLLTRDNPNDDSEFIAEVEILSCLHHCNLVKLIGICIEGHRRCLVYELIPNGSVESHLHGADKEKGPLDWEARMKIALGAARGLAYLHEDSNPRVIHRDFKASNVLLEDDFTPKICDFGMAREATKGSHHISTQVMGTFGYLAPEYAMTGHLLIKSDVYSYGVVLLELLTGRKPVDMSQPSGQENLVTWARPLLVSRGGLEQLVDSSLAGSYDFDDTAKVAAIASICVHPEVTHRPFMGEVVQALKLIYNDADETCGDCSSQKGSSTHESDFRVDLAPSESSWWNAGGVTPRLTYGQASSFITMEYSSGPLEMENRPFSTSSLIGGETSLPVRHGNRSGPLKKVRSKLSLYKFTGSRSEHGGFPSKKFWNEGFWV